MKFYGIELEEVTSVPQSDLPEFVAFSSDSPAGSPKPAPAAPAEKFEIDRFGSLRLGSYDYEVFF